MADGAVEHAENQNIVITTHGFWIVTLMRYFQENPEKFDLIDFDMNATITSPMNTGVTRFTIQPVLPRLTAAATTIPKRILVFTVFNDTRHLNESSTPSVSNVE